MHCRVSPASTIGSTGSIVAMLVLAILMVVVPVVLGAVVVLDGQAARNTCSTHKSDHHDKKHNEMR